MALAATSRPKLSTKARLVWDRVEERHVLLYPERGLALNAIAAAVVRELDAGLSVAEIASAIAAQFPGASHDEVERDVLGFLDELEARALLEQAAP